MTGHGVLITSDYYKLPNTPYYRNNGSSDSHRDPRPQGQQSSRAPSDGAETQGRNRTVGEYRGISRKSPNPLRRPGRHHEQESIRDRHRRDATPLRTTQDGGGTLPPTEHSVYGTWRWRKRTQSNAKKTKPGNWKRFSPSRVWGLKATRLRNSKLKSSAAN